MLFEINTPNSCNDCIFCYDGCDCLLADEPCDSESLDSRQIYCPFDNKGNTVKASQIVNVFHANE